MVPDEEWERYIEPRMREVMLCKACYTQIKDWIDGAAEHRRQTAEQMSFCF